MDRSVVSTQSSKQPTPAEHHRITEKAQKNKLSKTGLAPTQNNLLMEAQNLCSMTNPDLIQRAGRVEYIICDDISKLVGNIGKMKPASTTFPVIEPETGEQSTAIIIDSEKCQNSLASLVSIINFELHRIAAGNTPKEYPQGMASLLEKNIADMKEIEKVWNNSANTAEATSISELSTVRTKILSEMKKRVAPINQQQLYSA